MEGAPNMGDCLLILLLAPWSHIRTHPYFEIYLVKLLRAALNVLGTWVLIGSAIFYQVALDSDAGLFGGFGRIHHAAEHFTTVSFVSHENALQLQHADVNSLLKMWANFSLARHYLQDCSHDNRPHSFSVYTPSRTCVVYAPADTMTPEISEESK